MTGQPDDFSRAVAMHRSGQYAQAEQLYRQVVAANPQHVECLHLLGLLLHQRGQHEPGIRLMHEALAIHRDKEAFLHSNLGAAYGSLGRFKQAVEHLEQAAAIAPSFADAQQNLASAHMELRQYEQAAVAFRAVVGLKPNDPEAHRNLGRALREIGRLDEALACYDEALAIDPNHAPTYNSKGNLLRDLGRFEEAIQHYQRSLDLDPGAPQVFNNAANTLRAMGDIDTAIANFDEALHLKPDYYEAMFNRGYAQLLGGRLPAGWEGYEYRWYRHGLSPRPFSVPRWEGTALAGHTILLHAEQTEAETIQFIRFAPLVKQHGARVKLECPGEWISLLNTASGIDEFVPRGDELGDFDVEAPLPSLPYILQTSLATIPAQIPYLRANATRIDRWRGVFRKISAQKVGIFWQGNPQEPGDRQRSIPLHLFAPLAKVRGVRLVSLQRGPGVEQIAALEKPFPMVDLGIDFADNQGLFSDTAAVMMNLDLVVTCDAAVAHLAGALGVAVWVLVPFAPDWRWMLGRSDSPWYPTMRIFRQPQPGDWKSVLSQVVANLKA